MRFGGFHARLLAIVGSAHLFDAYDATALAFVLPALLTVWHLSPVEIGYLLSAGYVGQLVGAIAGGVIAERIGRRATLCIALVILALFSAGCALANSYMTLLILRLVQGLGLGGETPVAATYINEMVPTRMRGRMVSAIQWLFAIGTIVASVAAPILVPRFGWQVMFVLGTAPLLTAGVLWRLLPESPMWLVSRGRAREAAAALERMGAPCASSDIGVTDPTAPLEPTRWTDLFAPGQKRATFSAWIIAFCAAFVGYGIIGWMPTLYRIVYHLSVEQALRYGIANGVAALLGGCIGLAFIDRVSRKVYLTFGFSGCALALFALALISGHASPLGSAILSGGGYMLLGMPLAGIYVYAPEIYPVRLRALGAGLTSAWLRLASILGPPIMGAILTYGSMRTLFLLLGTVAALGAAGTAVLAVDRRKLQLLDG